MAWGVSDEKREARSRAEAEKAEQVAAAEFWASPQGQAAAAKLRGDRFFQLEIEASLINGESFNFMGMSFDRSKTKRSSGTADLLGQIEELGWHLEHVTHVFIETRVSSRPKREFRGGVASTSGRVEGIYLFRATDDALDPEEVPYLDLM